MAKYTTNASVSDNPTPNRQSLPPPARLADRHFPERNVISSAGKPTQLNCSVCSFKKENGRKRTIYSCNECQVALHCTLFSSVPHIHRSSTLFVKNTHHFTQALLLTIQYITIYLSLYTCYSLFSHRDFVTTI